MLKHSTHYLCYTHLVRAWLSGCWVGCPGWFRSCGWRAVWPRVRWNDRRSRWSSAVWTAESDPERNSQTEANAAKTEQTRGFTTQISCVNWGLLGSRTQTHTFPSRMVSQVALFLPTGHSSISCMDTSYSPSNNCRRLHASTRQRLLTSDAQTLQWHLFFPVPKGATVCARRCMCVCLSPVFIKDCHLSYKCGFSLLPESRAPPFPVHSFFWKVWKRHTVTWTSAPPNRPSFSARMWSYEGDCV